MKTDFSSASGGGDGIGAVGVDVMGMRVGVLVGTGDGVTVGVKVGVGDGVTDGVAVNVGEDGGTGVRIGSAVSAT